YVLRQVRLRRGAALSRCGERDATTPSQFERHRSLYGNVFNATEYPVSGRYGDGDDRDADVRILSLSNDDTESDHHRREADRAGRVRSGFLLHRCDREVSHRPAK